METICNHFAINWGFKQPAVIGLVDLRYVLIKLALAEDMAVTRTRGSHRMEGAMFNHGRRIFTLAGSLLLLYG